jgi:hypothetical protein
MNPTHADKRLVIDSILASLRDLNSISCGAKIMGLLCSYLMILDSTASSLPMEFDKAILTRALWFFSAPRSDDEMERLLRTPCTCPPVDQRDQNDVWAHDTVKKDLRSGRWKWPVQLVFNRFLMYLSKAMVDRPLRTGKYFPHINRIGYLGVWPDMLDQILPHGPEDTFRGLVQWFKADIGDGNREKLLQVINCIYAYTSPKILPHMITAGTLITHDILPVLALGSDPARSDLEVAEEALQTCDTFFWWGMMHRCDPTHRRILLQGHAVKLLGLCDRVIQRLRREHMKLIGRDKTREESIQVLGWTLDRFAGILVQELFWWTNGKIAYKALTILPLPHLHSFWSRTLKALESSSEGQCCGLPDCIQTFLDTNSFRLCSGCRRVTYCSRRYQIRAWTHPAVPHREVCGMIHRICTESGIPRIRICALKDKEPDPEVFDEALGQSIAEHFEASTRYRMTRLSSTGTSVSLSAIVLIQSPRALSFGRGVGARRAASAVDSAS